VGGVPVVEHDLPSSGPVLARTHRPDRHLPGVFGPGFWTVLDVGLRASDGVVSVGLPSGDELRFVPTSTGWLCTAGPHHHLVSLDDQWRLTCVRQLDIVFDRDGRWCRWQTGDARFDIARDSVGHPVTLTDASRRRFHLDWVDDRIAQVATDAGATVPAPKGPNSCRPRVKTPSSFPVVQ